MRFENRTPQRYPSVWPARSGDRPERGIALWGISTSTTWEHHTFAGRHSRHGRVAAQRAAPREPSCEPGQVTDKGSIRVFLLDDHEVVRRGVHELLSIEDDLDVVGEAGTAAEALVRIPATRPHVAV